MMNKSTRSFKINLFAIIVFGLIILASATSVVGYAHFGDNFYYLKHQLLYGLLPGVLLFFICSRIPYRFWQKNAWWLLLLTIILLLLVFIPGIGVSYNSARSWINLGGFSLQPSELAKLILLIYLAAFFTRLDARQAKTREHVQSFAHGFLPFIFVTGLVAGLVALEPDVGTAAILGLIALGAFFVAGAKISHIIGLFVLGGGMLGILIATASYRLNRFLAFLKPETDMQGIGYHISQSLIAVGSGGLIGLGLGHSRQKFEYLPEVAGDSIFAVMAEEIGFIFCFLFLIALLFLILKILKISKYSSDNFVKIFGAGLAIWIGGQSIINIGAMLGILPLTGVPLPFISYGGTALMTLMASAGILVNMAENS